MTRQVMRQDVNKNKCTWYCKQARSIGKVHSANCESRVEYAALDARGKIRDIKLLFLMATKHSLIIHLPNESN